MNAARDHAFSIWRAGVEAVRAESLIQKNVTLRQNWLSICQTLYALEDVRRIHVVGAGKAAGYLAIALERCLSPIAATHQLDGWVNVPANCVSSTRYVHLHAARPANANEPTEDGVRGTARMLQAVGSMGPNDMCLCLLTGGGSALMPAPAEGITLADKLEVTRMMSARGADIRSLNRVRTALSAVKGGGLYRACRAGTLITLIVSDVIGDPLEIIASGPTIRPPQHHLSPHAILLRYASESEISPRVWKRLEESAREPNVSLPPDPAGDPHEGIAVHRNDHYVLANNGMAVAAAADCARGRGFAVTVIPPEPADTAAEEVAAGLLDHVMQVKHRPACLIWGGEPVVNLVSESQRGLGGRNQQLALAVLHDWNRLPSGVAGRVCILSAGTDGEDGPTDAAGAFVDTEIVDAAVSRGLSSGDYLCRNDAYRFFDQTCGLLRTGPTHTNVCDLRVAVIE